MLKWDFASLRFFWKLLYFGKNKENLKVVYAYSCAKIYLPSHMHPLFWTPLFTHFPLFKFFIFYAPNNLKINFRHRNFFRVLGGAPLWGPKAPLGSKDILSWQNHVQAKSGICGDKILLAFLYFLYLDKFHFLALVNTIFNPTIERLLKSS